MYKRFFLKSLRFERTNDITQPAIVTLKVKVCLDLNLPQNTFLKNEYKFDSNIKDEDEDRRLVILMNGILSY